MATTEELSDLQSFFNDPTTRPEDIEVLRKFLKARPVREGDGILRHPQDLEEKVDLMKQLLDKIRDYSDFQNKSLSYIHVATFLILPISFLKEAVDQTDFAIIQVKLNAMHSFLSLVLKGRMQGIGPESDGQSGLSSALPALRRSPRLHARHQSLPEVLESLNISTDSTCIASEQRRNPPASAGRCRGARTRALERDGSRCIIMGTKQPDCCHIMPFSVNKNDTSRSLTQQIASMFMGPILGVSRGLEAGASLYGSVRASDEAWNLLCLNTQLHRWWGEARWGFKFGGYTPTGEVDPFEQVLVQIKLVFYWMKCRNADALAPATPSIELARNMFSGSSGPDFTPFAVRYPSGRPILSGDIFTIELAEGDAKKMACMINIQWAIVQIAAMSGAADMIDRLPEPRDPDEDGHLRLFNEGHIDRLLGPPRSRVPTDDEISAVLALNTPATSRCSASPSRPRASPEMLETFRLDRRSLPNSPSSSPENSPVRYLEIHPASTFYVPANET